MISQFSIINKILQTKDYSLVYSNNLDDKYFFNYKTEFNFIKSHYNQYKCVPDKLTFANVFPDFEFVDINEPNTFLLEQLYKDYNTSYIANNFNTVKKLIGEGKDEKALELYKTGVEGLHSGTVMTCVDLIQDTSRYDRYLERTADQAKYYLKTGFAELDAIVGGIDRENENMVIIARPGVGKTQILLKMAAVASMQGLCVGIYEGEMTADKVGYRIDTFIGNIKNASINRGDIFIQKEYKKYIDSLANRGFGPIKVFTPTDIPNGIVTVDTLRMFVEREKIDILFVDQYDLLDDTSYYNKTEPERIGNIAKAIKKLQVEKLIPIISVSQMNRTKNEDGSQDTTQVAGSDKIGRYATTMIALEQKIKEDSKQVQLTLNIIKARDGGDHNKLTYDVNFNTGEFNYIPSDTDGVSSDEDFEAIENSYTIDFDESGNIF